MKRAIAALGFATLCLCGCGRPPAALDAAAERYVHLALAVAARDPDSLDFYAGPPAWRTEAERAYRPLEDVRHDLTALEADVRAAGDDDARRVFLTGQINALVSRIDLLHGTRLPFAQEAQSLFGIDVAAPDERAIAQAHRALDDLQQRLPGRGSLLERFVDYRRPQVLAPDRVRPVFEAALADCRERTRAHLVLPDDESVSVEYASTQSPWSAFTRYTGSHHSIIAVNTAFAFTGDDLRDLACHEGYPGHHTAYVLQDDALVHARHRIELAIEPLFSPQALLSEAAASYAPVLVHGGQDGVESLVDRLDPLRLDIARRYLDGDLEFARAADALEQKALTPSAAATLKFVNEFRTYVVTYTAGRERVARVVEAAGDDGARWEAYRKLVLAGTLP